jgi:hypothetical protein
MNVLEGSRRGLEIYLEDDRLYLNCASLFQDAGGRLHSLRLGSRSPLRTQQWIHLSVSFEAASGRLRLFLDGREDNVAHTGDASGVWQMTFHPLDRSPIVIAETYAGFLDEFRISSRALQPDASHLQTATYAPLRLDYETLRGQQQMGQVISDVMRPSGGTARSGRLRYVAQEPDGTLVNFYARFARQPFAKDTPAAQLPWRRLSPDEARGVQMFSYFQWRAELRADASGLISPVLREVVLDYQPLLAPPAPGNLRAVPDFRLAAGLVLEWDESPETRVQTGGGYYVYFGLRPGEYLGRLHVNAQGQPIRASTAGETPLSDAEKKLGHSRPERLKQSLRNRMRLLIDNDLIQTNTPPNAQAPRLPYLHANRSYYFAVSSYDDVGVESQLSNEVVVTIRPPAD